MQIKLTVNAKITLNINCSCQDNQEKCPPYRQPYFQCSFRKWDYFCMNGVIFNIKNKASFTKMGFLKKAVANALVPSAININVEYR